MISLGQCEPGSLCGCSRADHPGSGDLSLLLGMPLPAQLGLAQGTSLLLAPQHMLISACLLGRAVCFLPHPSEPMMCLFSPYKFCKSLGAISCPRRALAKLDPSLAALPHGQHNTDYILQHAVC